jgi:catechol 2,3-dioxygenase-like lactoylglutathione lyase family enzyme
MEDIRQKQPAQPVRDPPLFDPCGIDHVGIRYQDLKQAVAWFRETLGLTIDNETPAMAFVCVGDDAQLALFQAGADEPPRQPHHVALRVPDVAAAEAALRAAGIPLNRFGPNWGFQDPEGNVFHFTPSQ